VLTGAGLGLALPWVRLTGWSAGSVVGCLALVGGVVLLAFAGRLLGRGRRWWTKAGVAAGLVVATALSSLVVGQAVAASYVPPSRVGSATPATYGLAYTEVHPVTTDGVRLAAWWVPSRNGAAVVLLHGAHSTRSAVLRHAAVLARHGYGALLLDARGHGRSGGRAMDFGWWGDSDVRAAVDLVTTLPGVTGDVAVLGLSMGGEEAIGAAASDPRIAAVVAEGATARVAADKNWLVDAYGFSGRLQHVLDAATYGLAGLLSPASAPSALRSSMAAIAPRPVLLVSAATVPDEARAARHLASAAPATTTTWDVPGAGHTKALATDPDGWAARVVGFLDRVLGTRTAAGTAH